MEENSRCLFQDTVSTVVKKTSRGSLELWSKAGLPEFDVVGRARSEPGGTRWRTGGEVKGKLVNGVGSQYSHATSERGVSRITQADAHTSAASSRLNWHPPPI